MASYPFRLGPPGAKWATTPFGGLAIVNNLSASGDSIVTVALAGSVFVSVSLNAARDRTALGLLCTVLPFAVVGPFVGPAIDRMRGGRKFIVFLACIGRIAACLMMASWIHSLLLFPAAFLSLVCSKTHSVAKAALVPGVVETESDLVRANARLAVGLSIYTSLAGALGGTIYKLFGSRVLLDLDVLIFSATAALSLYLLSGARESVGPLEPNDGITEGNGPPPRRKGLIGGISAAMKPGPRPVVRRDVFLAQVAMAGMRAVAGFMTALIIFAFRKQGAPIIWYGLVAVSSVGGNFFGALSAARLRDRFSERALVASASLLIAGTAIGVTQLGGLHRRPAALILAAVIGLGASVAKTAFDAIVQGETRDSDRSRLFARFESIFQLAWVVGALIPTLVFTPLLVGYIVIGATVVGTSASFVLGVATRFPDPPPRRFGGRSRSRRATVITPDGRPVSSDSPSVWGEPAPSSPPAGRTEPGSSSSSPQSEWGEPAGYQPPTQPPAVQPPI